MSTTHSRLLIDEQPLQVLPSLVVAIGMNEAILLQQIHYWLHPDRNSGKVIDGRRWIYNSYSDWSDQFPFWTQRVIASTIRKLETLDLLDSRQDLNEKPSDRTKWYSLNYESAVLNGTMMVPNSVPSIVPNSVPCIVPNSVPSIRNRDYTETTTEITNTSSSDFESFWKAYPSKVGKKAALAAFTKHTKGISVDILISAIDEQKKSERWTKDNGQYIPNPATWLNQGRWDDKLAPPSNSSQPQNMQTSGDEHRDDDMHWLGDYAHLARTSGD